jgi:hypothetical protein
MEPQKVEFMSKDITFHSRCLRPTQSFKRACLKAREEGSGIVRVYGIPKLVMDPKTKLIYLKLDFSEDISKRIQSGKLTMKLNTPLIIDKETKIKIANKEKRRLKNSTRVWRKNN